MTTRTRAVSATRASSRSKEWGISEWGSMASIVSAMLLLYLNFGRSPSLPPVVAGVFPPPSND